MGGGEAASGAAENVDGGLGLGSFQSGVVIGGMSPQNGFFNIAVVETRSKEADHKISVGQLVGVSPIVKVSDAPVKLERVL